MKSALAVQAAAAALLALAVTPADAAEFNVRVHSNTENRDIETLSATTTDSINCTARTYSICCSL